jgi:hypothetical protein
MVIQAPILISRKSLRRVAFLSLSDTEEHLTFLTILDSQGFWRHLPGSSPVGVAELGGVLSLFDLQASTASPVTRGPARSAVQR